MAINPMNNALKWLVDMINFFGEKEIKVPSGYRDQVLVVKEALNNDVSGLVSSLLDFAINCALVQFRVETNNVKLTEKLNNWLTGVNSELRGKIPVGINALAKEYFRERWKGSSFLLLRSVWEKSDGFKVPTKLWFVDGEDIAITNDDKEMINLGDEKYGIRINEAKIRAIPSSRNERLFIQKPYTSWGTNYPTPYLIQRGVFKNMKLLSLLEEKGEFIVSRAIEYLMLLKKGTERMALDGRSDFIYSDDDLSAIKENFSKFVKERKSQSGPSAYVTNFDTEMEHSIPDYKKGLEAALYEPIQQRILSGLGIVEVVEGIASSRREGIMNPKPFISEVNSAIDDFKTLVEDILYTIVDENSRAHPKYFKGEKVIRLHATPVKEFISDNLREHLRSAYDRGDLSKRTYTSVVCNLDFDVEVNRRKEEYKNNIEVLMYPHIINNQEQHISPIEERRTDKLDKKPIKKEDEDERKNETEKEVKQDRTGPEKKNFQSSFEKGFVRKRKDGWYVLSEKNKVLGGPYKTKKEALKRLREIEYFKNK